MINKHCDLIYCNSLKQSKAKQSFKLYLFQILSELVEYFRFDNLSGINSRFVIKKINKGVIYDYEKNKKNLMANGNRYDNNFYSFCL